MKTTRTPGVPASNVFSVYFMRVAPCYICCRRHPAAKSAANLSLAMLYYAELRKIGCGSLRPSPVRAPDAATHRRRRPRGERHFPLRTCKLFQPICKLCLLVSYNTVKEIDSTLTHRQRVPQETNAKLMLYSDVHK